VTATNRLHFYPWDKWPEYRSVITEAKNSINSGITVTPTEARPGALKVLAVEVPNFICDYALVKSGSVEGFVAALEWYFGVKDDPRVTTAAKMLSHIMGGEVVERYDTD
jgi:hypothetical protein